MTRVDFYVLKQVRLREQAWQYASRLVHKASRQGHSVYIHSDDKTCAEQLDKLLWKEPVDAFIPHSLLEQGEEKVNIGYGNLPGKHSDVMLNLSDKVPEFFSRFSRVIELVTADSELAEVQREHYKFYKKQGFPLHSHNIDRL